MKTPPDRCPHCWQRLPENRETGADLKRLRKAAGLTLREMAAKLGVHYTYISKVENDREPVPVSMPFRYREALGLLEEMSE